MSEVFPEKKPVPLDFDPSEKRWYISPEGRIVGAHETGWQFYIRRLGFIPLHMHTENPQIDAKNVCLISRPRGGIGDIICIVPAVATFIEEHGFSYKRIMLRFPKEYKFLFRAILKKYPWVYFRDYSRYREIPTKTFRTLYRIWCPAGLHEQKTQYRPIRSRIENFADLLRVKARAMHIELALFRVIWSFLWLFMQTKKKKW